MASQEAPSASTSIIPCKYSNRIVLKTILGREDGCLGLVGERVVVGGWVKSSKEVRMNPPVAQLDEAGGGVTGPKDVSGLEILLSRIPMFGTPRCLEILLSRIPFFRTVCRTIIRVLGAGGYPVREKLESAVPKRRPPSITKPPPPIAVLRIRDGSCATSLQVVVDSSIFPPSQLLPIGTCILAEGVLKQPPVQGKHDIELKTEKILHVGLVDQDNYPLSKIRLPLENLRDCSHFRPRTTTVASIMIICSSLTFATHTFFQNLGFQYVQVPIITTTDSEGFSEKFHVITLLGKEGKKEEPNAVKDIEGVSLEAVKSAIKEKNKKVEELKRTDSNKEALFAALQDVRKTNARASQLEAREKSTLGTLLDADKVNFSEDFFSRETFLTGSGRLHLESYACALGNVYSFGPRFRVDKTNSAKHAAEIWIVEIEMAFSQLEDAMNCAVDFLKFLCIWVLENCSEDMKFFLKRIDKTRVDLLQSVISSSCEKISYSEAVDVLKRVTDKNFETVPEWGSTLKEEHLSYLADEIYKRPVIVHSYPTEVKPFYVRLNDDGKTVAAFDLIVPKIGTLLTGSQNEERFNISHERIKELGLEREQYEWYLDLRRHGTVKHSGFSFGFDLMVLFATGVPDIREAIPFPRSYGKANN